MSVTSQPICSSTQSYGDPSSSTIYRFVSTDGDTMRISTPRTPASSGASGFPGEYCWDSLYFYVCTATDTWQRMALVPF